MPEKENNHDVSMSRRQKTPPNLDEVERLSESGPAVLEIDNVPNMIIQVDLQAFELWSIFTHCFILCSFFSWINNNRMQGYISHFLMMCENWRMNFLTWKIVLFFCL